MLIEELSPESRGDRESRDDKSHQGLLRGKKREDKGESEGQTARHTAGGRGVLIAGRASGLPT